jgi:hypothetical protein
MALEMARCAARPAAARAGSRACATRGTAGAVGGHQPRRVPAGGAGERGCAARAQIDVYLDLVNRGKTLEMLIGYAAQQPETQYIMLTPLDVTAIGEARKRVERAHTELSLAEDFVTIKRMPPPRR